MSLGALLALLLAWAELGDAMKCYQIGAGCLTKEPLHHLCVDNLGPYELTECSSPLHVCHMHRNFNGTLYRTLFGCATEAERLLFGPVQSCTYGKNDREERYQYTQCMCNDHDGCNSATSNLPTTLLLSTLTGFVLTLGN